MSNMLPSGESRGLLPDASGDENRYLPAESEFDWREYWNILVKRWKLVALVSLVLLSFGAYFTFTATPLYTATSTLKIEPQNPTVTSQSIGNNIDGSIDYYGTQIALLKSRRLATKVINELDLGSNVKFVNSEIWNSSFHSRMSTLVLGNLQSLLSFFTSYSSPPPKAKARSDSDSRARMGADDNTKAQLGIRNSPYAGRYVSMLNINWVKGTRLVDVQFTTPDPELSQIMANAHARAFVALNMETRKELTEEARKFLDSKSIELKKSLAESEEKLNRFRQAHGVVSMERGENIVVDRMIDVNRKLTEASSKRIEAESLYRFVENKPVQSLAEVVTQGLVPSLRTALQALENERVKYSFTYKPDHPRMLEFDRQITEARKALNAEIANVVRGIAEGYSAALAREQALQAEASRQQRAALGLKELGAQYAVVEEEVKINRALHENVLKNLHATAVSNDVAMTNMAVFQYADRPVSPSAPNTMRDLGVVAALGLFFGLGLIFVLEYLDSSVSTPQLVWRAVALSTFGVVPDLKSLKPLRERIWGTQLLNQLTPAKFLPYQNSPGSLILDHHPLSVLTECYRTIRTSLLFSKAEKPPQIILLSSASPGEGKTVTTLNLAVAMAQDGHKVLVIDADLRKGQCHIRLGLKHDRGGLSNILTGNMALSDGIQETSVGGLFLIPRGHCPPNPGDLLGSRRMKELLATLRESFDFVFVDSPPAIAVSDAAVLSSIVDGVIVVFHAKKTTKASARQVIERLDAVRAPILGTVLNGVDLRNPDYAYYRTYYGSDYGTLEDHHTAMPKPIAVAVEKVKVPSVYGKSPVSEVVSRDFFEKMISKLSEAMGPFASMVVSERVALLGESLDTFPTVRLNELFEQVAEEILNKDMRRSFEAAMAEEVRFLH